MEPSDVDVLQERMSWSNKLDFIFSCMSYAIGLGNVWRFPYLCYSNGGGAFLIPFIIMLFLAGIPMVFLELSFGQYAHSGVVSVWKVCPLFEGVGWGMFIVSSLICIYYNMIIAWTMFYMFASFTSMLPWTECGDWSTSACKVVDVVGLNNCTLYNGTWFNDTCHTVQSVGEDEFTRLQNYTNHSNANIRSPSDDYFHKHVLDISPGIDDMGAFRWQLSLCLLFSWVLTCACLIKGIKSAGKAVYFTALFPYVVLSILLVRSLMLPGAIDGIMYYITPQWHRLATAKVWGDAAIQIFYSLSPCWGGLITLASYNKFHNNCFSDAIIVSVMDSFTSIFAGFVIFAIIGYMSHELQVEIGDVAAEGPGLAFIVYPDAVTRLPISPLWSILFFSMLITLGLGSQIATVTTVHTTLVDQFPQIFRRGHRSSYLIVALSVLFFLIALAFCFQGGMYVLQMFDAYAATYSLIIIGLTECVALAWVYGAQNFLNDIAQMIGRQPPRIFEWLWKVIVPVALVFIMIFTWIDFKPTKYGEYEFPAWADGVGWVMTLTSVLAIPVVAAIKLYKQSRKSKNKTFREILRLTMKPEPDWFHIEPSSP